jgi:hypothetical protein
MNTPVSHEIINHINQIIEDTVSDYSSHADQTIEQYLIARYVPEIRIGDVGAIVLAALLKHNTTIKQLELQCSDLSDVGAIALAEAIKHNTTLELVVLEETVFSEKSSTALANIRNRVVLDEEKKVYYDSRGEESFYYYK